MKEKRREESAHSRATRAFRPLFEIRDMPLLANQNRASFTFKFSNLPAFSSAPPSTFPAKAEESSRFVSVGCCPDVFVWHPENKNSSSTSQTVSLLKKILVSRNELREIENIGARDVDVLIANFLLQVYIYISLGYSLSLRYSAQCDNDTDNDNTGKNYIGLTEGTFKQQYTQHKLSFRNRKYANHTELAKLKDNKENYKISWSIISSASA